MVGGAWEYVMGGYSTNGSSITNKYMDFSVRQPYADIYTNISNNSDCTWLTCGGAALYETRKWGQTWDSFISDKLNWFDRSAGYGNGAAASLFFADRGNGSSTNDNNGTFRVAAITAE